MNNEELGRNLRDLVELVFNDCVYIRYDEQKEHVVIYFFHTEIFFPFDELVENKHPRDCLKYVKEKVIEGVSR